MKMQLKEINFFFQAGTELIYRKITKIFHLVIPKNIYNISGIYLKGETWLYNKKTVQDTW